MSVPPPSCVPNSASTGPGQQRRQVRDRRAEHHQRGPRRPHRRQHRPGHRREHHRREHHRGGHRARPVDRRHDVAGGDLLPAPYPTSRSGLTVRCDGTYRDRFAAIVRFQSMSRGPGRRVRPARFSAPGTAEGTRVSSSARAIRPSAASWRLVSHPGPDDRGEPGRQRGEPPGGAPERRQPTPNSEKPFTKKEKSAIALQILQDHGGPAPSLNLKFRQSTQNGRTSAHGAGSRSTSLASLSSDMRQPSSLSSGGTPGGRFSCIPVRSVPSPSGESASV